MCDFFVCEPSLSESEEDKGGVWDPQAQVFFRSPYTFPKQVVLPLPQCVCGRGEPPKFKVQNIYIHRGRCLVCGVARKRVKQKGVDTVGADDGKGYRDQRWLIGYTRGNNKKARRTEDKGEKINPETTGWCSYDINGRDQMGEKAGGGGVNKVTDGSGKRQERTTR